MKKLILNAIDNRGVNITELHKLIPIVKGKKTLYLITPEGHNNKIVLLKNVTQKFIDVFNGLLMKRKIEVFFVDAWVFLADESPIYTNIMQNEDMKSNRECWLPVQVKRN